MPTKKLAFLVEGQGDEPAVSILVRRIAMASDPGLTVEFHKTRVHKGQLLKEDEFSRFLDRARRYLPPGDRGILVLMDADADCPKQINELLLGWAKKHHSDLSVAVVVAKREMEAWFVAGAESLKPGLGIHADAESMPDPKAWVAKHILGGPYTPTGDQARLAARLDLDAARCIQSFNKFYRDVSRLLS